nr:ROK family protein [Actinobaculum suis]
MGGTKIAGGLVVLPAPDVPEVHLLSSVATQASRGGAAVLETVVDFAQDLLAQAREAGLEPQGIGVSSAGVIAEADGAIASATDTMPGWAGQPLGAALREACHLPVAVLNDVHGHALGEASFGAARGARTALVFAIGTGMGGAAVFDGQVHRGARGVSGHFGHVYHPLAAGLTCSCGRESHIESVASGSGLARLWAKRAAAQDPAAQDPAAQDPANALAAAPWRAASYTGRTAPAEPEASAEPATPQSSTTSAAPEQPAPEQPVPGHQADYPREVSGGGEVAARAAAGSKFAAAVLQDSARALGQVIAGLANCLDPDVIVLSGSVTQAGTVWREALAAGFAESAMTPVREVPLARGTLGGKAPLIGAAIHCYQQYLQHH